MTTIQVYRGNNEESVVEVIGLPSIKGATAAAELELGIIFPWGWVSTTLSTDGDGVPHVLFEGALD